MLKNVNIPAKYVIIDLGISFQDFVYAWFTTQNTTAPMTFVLVFLHIVDALRHVGCGYLKFYITFIVIWTGGSYDWITPMGNQWVHISHYIEFSNILLQAMIYIQYR